LRALVWLFYDLPVSILRLPFLQRILQSRACLLFHQYVGKPLLWTLPLSIGLYCSGATLAFTVGAGALILAVSSLLLNSRIGKDVEEIATDHVIRAGQLISQDIVPGLVRLVLFLFKRLVEDIERLLYTVDEWLRFRSGDNPLSLYVKGAIG